MRQKHAVKRNSAQADTSVGASRQPRRSIVAVMQFLHGKFGSKAALELALRADADQRSAERWLSKRKSAAPSAENFANLIRSDVGGDVLAVLMGDDPAHWPAWYAQARRQLGISNLKRGLAQQQKAIEALEREGAL